MLQQHQGESPAAEAVRPTEENKPVALVVTDAPQDESANTETGARMTKVPRLSTLIQNRSKLR